MTRKKKIIFGEILRKHNKTIIISSPSKKTDIFSTSSNLSLVYGLAWHGGWIDGVFLFHYLYFFGTLVLVKTGKGNFSFPLSQEPFPQEHDVDAFLCLPLGAHFSFPYLLPLSSQVNQTASKDSRAKVVFSEIRRKKEKVERKIEKYIQTQDFCSLPVAQAVIEAVTILALIRATINLSMIIFPEFFFLQEFLPRHDDHHHCITAHVT